MQMNFVVFDGHMKWTLNCNNQVILCYKDGVYKFPFQSKKSKLNTEIDKIFISQNDKTEIITDIIKSAALQKHGTLIIMSDTANSEATRLCKVRRGFKIESLALYKQKTVIEKISSIDGALLIDFNGICYAIGVILDGIVKNSGNSARGARYNSALTYIENHEDISCVAVVISEDGSIDLIPSKSMH